MKRFLLFVAFIVALMVSSYTWGATWYVDGWNGDDSNGGTGLEDEFLTIRRALNHCSNSDSIRIVGPFAEAYWDTSFGGGDSWDTNGAYDWRLQISVHKSNVTLYGVATEGNLPIIYSYSNSDTTAYTMRIDNTGNKVDNIKFDGYYDSENVNTHDVIYMSINIF